MTLLIYFPCKDGCVLISDRKETESVGGSPINKIFVAQDSSFAIAAAGDSSIIESLFAQFYSDHSINGINIKDKFGEKIVEIFPEDLKYLPQNPKVPLAQQEARFIIVAWQTGHAKLFYAYVVNGKHYVDEPSNDYHFVVGDGQGIVNHFLRRREYQKYSLKEAIAYGVAILQEVQPLIPTVGSLEEYGFSVIAYSKSDTVVACMDYRKSSPQITFNLQTDQFDMEGFTAKVLKNEAT